MSALAELTNEAAPDWLVAEMPAGYQNRVAEVRRLSDELRVLDRFGRLLWQVGHELTEAVRDAFVALGFDAALTPGPAAASVTVKVDAGRLLLHVSATEGPVEKKSKDLADVFQMLHERAEDTDRVVLVTNSDLKARPADRKELIGPDALNLLRRLGANVLAGPTVFALWTLSLQDRERARAHVERLYEQDGGTFVLPSVGTR